MIREMYWMTAHDTVNQPFVLHRMKDKKLAVMDEYLSLTCSKCKKVDEKRALSQGICPDVSVKSKRPILPSADDIYLLNARAKDAFGSILGGKIDFYKIPSGDYYAASATVVLNPDELDPGYRFLNEKCAQCGRLKEASWGKVPPTVPGVGDFFAVNLESRQGGREMWFFSKEVAAEFNALVPPLTGLVMARKDIDDGNPII